jgi:hypothetical protein
MTPSIFLHTCYKTFTTWYQSFSRFPCPIPNASLSLFWLLDNSEHTKRKEKAERREEW